MRYTDGSGNHTRIWGGSPGEPAHFTYDPMTPLHSSSGLYSGGEPAAGEVAPGQVEALWHWLEPVAADPRRHAELRTKGTGTFTLVEGEREHHFLVPRGERLDVWDALLATLRTP